MPGGCCIIEVTATVWVIEPIIFQPGETGIVSHVTGVPVIESVSGAANFNQYPWPLRSVSRVTYDPWYVYATETADGNNVVFLASVTATGSETMFQLLAK